MPEVAQQGRRKLLTIVMPAMNEEANLPRAYDEVTQVMAGLPYDYEVLVIDNASTDRTGENAVALSERDPRWRYVRFSRNFSVEISIAAGLRFARGDAAMVIFSDLQDPPKLIPDFLRKWEEGYDVVYGQVRSRQGDPLWKAWGARLFYLLINALSEVEITPNATDFRLLSRRAIDAVNQFDERNRYLRGFAHWVGFKRCPIVYDRVPRTAGKSKAPSFYLLNLAANAITCFSIKPLQLFSLCGVVAVFGTLCMALVYLGSWLFSYTVPGLTTVYLLMLANLAVMLLGFGTIGEYVGRIYIETKRRPLFLIDRAVNLDATTANVAPPALSRPAAARRKGRMTKTWFPRSAWEPEVSGRSAVQASKERRDAERPNLQLPRRAWEPESCDQRIGEGMMRPFDARPPAPRPSCECQRRVLAVHVACALLAH